MKNSAITKYERQPVL